MKINQLSVFLENRPGRLSTPCRALAAAGVNIITLSLADTQSFGILRIIVADWQRGLAALEAAGCTVNLAEVVAVPVADRPGGLAEVLEIIEQGRLNLEYMYAFTLRAGDRALMVFRFEDPDAAILWLKSKGVSVVDPVEYYQNLSA